MIRVSPTLFAWLADRYDHAASGTLMYDAIATCGHGLGGSGQEGGLMTA
jgi:hypothetical protein